MDEKPVATYKLSARITDFSMPPISDGLVVGKDSPIGHSAINRALQLLAPNKYQCIPVDDDVVGHVILRRNLLIRVSEGNWVAFVRDRIKPLMSAEEILDLALTVEVRISDSEP